ncbi:alpha-2-macroglobulin-like protein 1 [Prionailurus bengalensis]|uniref:alpha-2-macroglobulin-like protein 1 n=1 Tax=Prionailurus bengalensis TaxID=37029 RepID=UPI001CA8275D|nr:alpha-2-macroglobulin-like protein 1 [Prionailurus bengalensis]
MWARLLLGILALSPAIAEKSLPNYLVTLPAQLNFPSTQKVCLDLSPGNHDVKFTITLETKDKTQKLLETSGLKKRHFHCTSFLVPPPAGGTEEVATIWVSGTGNSINFVEKKKVLIQRQENGLFIQTDKPIYNPGHKVHFRIVTLNSSFLPVNDKYAMVELQVGRSFLSFSVSCGKGEMISVLKPQARNHSEMLAQCPRWSPRPSTHNSPQALPALWPVLSHPLRPEPLSLRTHCPAATSLPTLIPVTSLLRASSTGLSSVLLLLSWPFL